MSTIPDKKVQALEACEKVINGIEDGTISISSALLLCKKVARLVNDQDGMEWLDFELGGYPQDRDGYIVHDAWNIAAEHKRAYRTKDKKGKIVSLIFTELCNELESEIDSKRKALENFTTQGFSVSGELALLATNSMANNVAQNTKGLLDAISICERRLAILKSQYYDYAVKWKIELSFGKTAQSVFEEYRAKVDNHFSTMPLTALQKLNAIEDMMDDGNPEHYAQVLTSCRRLWSETAKSLFSELFPGYSQKLYKTKSGKEIDITGDHDNNKLSAVIEKLQSKAAKNSLVGSETVYLIDWMEQVNNRQSTGVHAEVTREQAMQCIIHTYITLGDILELKASVKS